MTRTRLLRLALPPALLLACGAIAFAATPPPASSPAAASATASAASAPPAADNGLQTPDYKIETSETHWNFNTGEFSMPHRVKFFRPGTDAVSDRATGNSKNGTASLYGHVVVHDNGETAGNVSKGAYGGSGPATLICDQLDVDSKAKLYIATGHVHFSQGTRSGSASKAILNRATGMLDLEGDVHLSDTGSTLTANSVLYNLNTKDAQVLGAPAVMSQPENGLRPPTGPPVARPKSPPRARPAKAPHGKKTSKPVSKPSAKPSPAHPAPNARPAASPRPASSPQPSPAASP
jgi:lipopolysaccharide export system protein LptA